LQSARAIAGCLRRIGAARKAREVYVNTPQSDKYLRSDSPDSLTGYIHYSNEALYPMWAHLEDAVREGTPRWNQTFGVEGGIFSGFFRTDEAKRDFLKGMHGFGRSVHRPSLRRSI
jgi:acetylserotonin N-methyltransferase